MQDNSELQSKILLLNRYIKKPLIVPAILTDNAEDCYNSLRKFTSFDSIDIDILDNTIVSGKTLDLETYLDIQNEVLLQSKRTTPQKIGVHFMVQDFHEQSMPHLIRKLSQIVIHYESFKKNYVEFDKFYTDLLDINPNISLGLAITVERQLEFFHSYFSNLKPKYDKFNFLHVMSVKAGAQGNAFIKDSITFANSILENTKFKIKFDGGINPNLLSTLTSNELAIINKAFELSVGSYLK